VKPNSRISVLDSFRGIAAIFVVIYHYTVKYSEIFIGSNFEPLFLFVYGEFGVQLFFIISGFVIFKSVRNINSVIEFVFKRFVRLFPTYWFCLCLTFIFTRESLIY